MGKNSQYEIFDPEGTEKRKVQKKLLVRMLVDLKIQDPTGFEP